MSTRRYTPRDFSPDKAGFGKVGEIRWMDPRELTAVQRPQMRAARLQHTYSCRIRYRAKHQWGTVAKFAAASNLPYDRFMKILRGEAIMRLEDVAQAQYMLLGVLEDLSHDDPGYLGPPKKVLRP